MELPNVEVKSFLKKHTLLCKFESSRSELWWFHWEQRVASLQVRMRQLATTSLIIPITLKVEFPSVPHIKALSCLKVWLQGLVLSSTRSLYQSLLNIGILLNCQNKSTEHYKYLLFLYLHQCRTGMINLVFATNLSTKSITKGCCNVMYVSQT